MKLKTLCTAVAGIVFTLCCAVSARAQNVSISVTGLRAAKGQVIVSIFRSEAEFKSEKPYQRLKFAKTGLANGVLNLSCSLPAGTYGFALLDDEDGNGKMEKSMIGVPKEGFGFSNFYLSGMSRPSFSDFKFELRSQPVKVVMKTRYM